MNDHKIDQIFCEPPKPEESTFRRMELWCDRNFAKAVSICFFATLLLFILSLCQELDNMTSEARVLREKLEVSQQRISEIEKALESSVERP